MTIIWCIFLAIIGAACGSFVGAMTYRMKKRLNWVSGRSMCEHCKHQLNALDLVPILSWLFLRGKCRYCGKKIGWSAPVLEVSVAAAFVISYLFWPFGDFVRSDGLTVIYPGQIFLFVLWLLIVVLLTALLVYDAKWRLLPDKLVWPLVGLSMMFAVLNYLFVQHLGFGEFFLTILLGMIPIAGVYGLLYLISHGKWIGLGDVKLGVAIGLLVNWQGGLLVLFGANFFGMLAILPLLIRKKLKPSSQIPFGPYLIVATFVAVIFGQGIVNFVRKNLLLM